MPLEGRREGGKEIEGKTRRKRNEDRGVGGGWGREKGGGKREEEREEKKGEVKRGERIGMRRKR